MDQNYDIKCEADVVGVSRFVEVIHSHNGIDREEEIYHGENHERPNDNFEEHDKMVSSLIFVLVLNYFRKASYWNLNYILYYY